MELRPEPFEAVAGDRGSCKAPNSIRRSGSSCATATRSQPSCGASPSRPARAGSARSACAAVAEPWPRPRAAAPRLRRVLSPRPATRRPRRRRAESDRRDAALRACGHARRLRGGCVREGARVSRLRAKCPDCKTFTAVAIGPEYECHSCGRSLIGGLVRVPQAWGDGGEAMAEAAWLALPYPGGGDHRGGHARGAEPRARGRPTRAAARSRRLLLRAHRRRRRARGAPDRLAVIWLDAHGDLNTPETSPSGNPWGMPLRMLIDSGAVDAGDVALVGARNLDPPEEEFIREPASTSARTGSSGRWRAPPASTSRSTPTCSSRASCRRSCPSPAGPRSPDVERILEGSAPDERARGGVQRPAARAGQRRAARPARRCARPVTAAPAAQV